MVSNVIANPISGRLPAWGNTGNTSKTASDLNYRETEILNQIRDKVSAGLGVPVKINAGSQSDCGQFNVALIGVGGASACGTRQPFLITRNMLTQMAEDENKYSQLMSMIQEQIQQVITLENSLRSNQHQAEQENTERKSHQIRNNMLSVLDFWNENRSEGRSWTQSTQGQALQQIANRYEQMLSAQ